MNLDLIVLKFLLAVSLGALMGLERDGSSRGIAEKRGVKSLASSAARKFSFIERGIPAQGIGGVRTYILVSILGSLTGLAYYYDMKELVVVVTSGVILFIIISFILNYFDKNTLGLTTEISIIINYLASFLLLTSSVPAKIIVAVVVFATLIVSMKSQLRSFVSKFSNKEIVDTTKFVLFALVILPFLPNIDYSLGDLPSVGRVFTELLDPQIIEATSVFNPFRIWLVVVFIMSINFIGYFATRVLGQRKSMNIIGLLGGLVSSTAVTEAMALQSRKNESNHATRLLVTGAVLANMTSFIRIVVVAAAVNQTLSLWLVPSMVTMTLAMGVWVIYSYLKHRHDKVTDVARKNYQELGLKFESPFSIKAALAFGAIFVVVLFFSSIALYLLGDSGFFVYSLIVSMTGMDAVTLATAGLLNDGIVHTQLAFIVIVSAASMNLFVKMLFAVVSSNRYFRVKVLKIFMATIILGLSVMAFQVLR